MKTKEKKALREKTIAELRLALVEMQDSRRADYLESQRGKLKNTGLLLHKKKDIARISSILREKELLHENA